jgi:hypothetical protein
VVQQDSAPPFGGTGVCTQGLTLARQALLSLRRSASLLSLIFQTESYFCPELALDCNPPTSTS